MKLLFIHRALTFGALALPALLSPQESFGQSPIKSRIALFSSPETDETPTPKVPVRHTRSKDFVLPFNLTESEKLTVKEVQLYVRTPDSPWQRRASAGPSEGKFEFKVVEEGEIWFAVVTCENNDQTNPADPRNMPPALRVVVDSTPPTFQMSAEQGKPPVNQPLLRLLAQDPQLEAGSLTVACMTGGTWHRLESLMGEDNLYALPPSVTGTWKIRAVCRDMAGNQGNFEGQFPTIEDKKVLPLAAANNPSAAQPTASMPEKKPDSQMPATVPLTDQKTSQKAAVSSGNIAGEPKAPAKPETTAPPIPNKVLVNSIQAQLEYAVEEVGPSGIGKVEIWFTQDAGLNWKLLAEDKDAKSPADCKLPGEGEFGITMVITNGSGAGGRVPTPGEVPEIILEVDSTKPTAKLNYAQVLATESGKGPALFTRWEAKDKNLGERPIRLLMSDSQSGPYLPIADTHPNSGEFKWMVPANCPPKLFLRLEVLDKAGNVTFVDHPAAVQMDPSRPKGRLLTAKPSKSETLETSEKPTDKKIAEYDPKLTPASFENPVPKNLPKLETPSPSEIPLATPTPAVPSGQGSSTEAMGTFLPKTIPPLVP